VVWLGASTGAAREIVHVVRDKQNLGMIARRYHTTPEAIRAHNGLEPTARIYPGQRLRIVEVEEHARWRRHLEARGKRVNERVARSEPEAVPPRGAAQRGEAKDAAPAALERAESYVRRPARAGHVTLVRGDEAFRGQLVDRRGRVLPEAARKLDRLLRSLKSGEEHVIDRRLLAALARVSDRFGGRTLVVVSGYRPYSPAQFTKSSRHNHGRAVDFRIVGVPNKVVRDYCLRLRDVGVGYYPNSSFVHLDVRKHKTQWTDYSRPGEPPIYAHERSGAKALAAGASDEAPAPPEAAAVAPAEGAAAPAAAAEPAIQQPPRADDAEAENEPEPEGE
jgi:uncharacterized protein YcbK (DUF882 family)